MQTIRLIRHFPVNYSFNKIISGDEIARALIDYDDPTLLRIPDPVPRYSFPGALYSSDLNRARITAEMIFGKAPIQDQRLREFVFEPIIDPTIKLPEWIWGILGRYFASKQKNESFKKPICEFLSDILSQSEDCTIVSHGYVMYVIRRELIRRGFKGKRFLTPRHGTVYTYTK